jgi:hypothetical protein
MVVSLYSKFGNHSKFPKPPAACGCQYTFTNTSTLKKGTTRILEPQPLQVNKTPMLGLPLRLSKEILGAHNTEIMMCCWLELTIPTLESNSFWIELHTLAYVHIRRWFWNQTQCHDQGSFCIGRWPLLKSPRPPREPHDEIKLTEPCWGPKYTIANTMIFASVRYNVVWLCYIIYDWIV